MDGSDEEEDKGIRKKPYRPEYAFGTPIRQNIVYSDLAHLGPGIVNFALALAAHTDGAGLSKRPESQRSPEKKKKVKRDKKPPPGIKPSSKTPPADIANTINDNNPGKEPLQPCTRQECKDVIEKIVSLQLSNEFERENIIRLCEEKLVETDIVAEECLELEETIKGVNQEGVVLEDNLAQLMEKLEKYEKRLAAQQQDRDELNNKVLYNIYTYF